MKGGVTLKRFIMCSAFLLTSCSEGEPKVVARFACYELKKSFREVTKPRSVLLVQPLVQPRTARAPSMEDVASQTVLEDVRSPSQYSCASQARAP